MQSKHNLFKYSLKEAIINLIFTACVHAPWPEAPPDDEAMGFSLSSLYVNSALETTMHYDSICKVYDKLTMSKSELSHTGAELSWCRIVPVPKCLAFAEA
jgi:hypothetical protein